ncbi:hypothetical protein [Deinococcus kurensis]|uniref:hypothetical protein n=1 Tax=Deinococcus kurensis TaxID=2662757 RepID=UPI0012D32D72|nr:hypothetical protein [Deinococcus kurensis]
MTRTKFHDLIPAFPKLEATPRSRQWDALLTQLLATDTGQRILNPETRAPMSVTAAQPELKLQATITADKTGVTVTVTDTAPHSLIHPDPTADEVRTMCASLVAHCARNGL